MPIDTSTMADAYIECALWASTDPDTCEPLDESGAELAAETRAEMVAECESFAASNAADLERFAAALDVGAAMLGHDLWLTRNRHGAGFWDRYSGPDAELRAIGARLTEAAHALGETDLYVADDGLIYATV